MPQPFTPRQLDQIDAAITRRVQAADWHASKPTKRVLAELGERTGHNLPFALPAVAAEIAAEPQPEHYSTWITLKGGDVRRHAVGFCVDEDEARNEAGRIGASLYGSRVAGITVMQRAA